MKKIILSVATVMLALTMFTACGRENVGDYTTTQRSTQINSTSERASKGDNKSTSRETTKAQSESVTGEVLTTSHRDNNEGSSSSEEESSSQNSASR